MAVAGPYVVQAGGSGQQRGAKSAAGSRRLEAGSAAQARQGSGGQGLHGGVRARRANQRCSAEPRHGDRAQPLTPPGNVPCTIFKASPKIKFVTSNTEPPILYSRGHASLLK